jgi:hypothetical protein
MAQSSKDTELLIERPVIKRDDFNSMVMIINFPLFVTLFVYLNRVSDAGCDSTFADDLYTFLVDMIVGHLTVLGAIISHIIYEKIKRKRFGSLLSCLIFIASSLTFFMWSMSLVFYLWHHIDEPWLCHIWADEFFHLFILAIFVVICICICVLCVVLILCSCCVCCGYIHFRK